MVLKSAQVIHGQDDACHKVMEIGVPTRTFVIAIWLARGWVPVYRECVHLTNLAHSIISCVRADG